MRGKDSTERLSDLGFASALVLALAAPILALSGVVEPIAALDGAVAHTLGIALFAFSTVVARAAQRTMGSAWRTESVLADPTGSSSADPSRSCATPYTRR